MSKFLYFQDMHISGINSKNRLGNYFEDCITKFTEIVKIAKSNKCEAILDGGDLFATKKPAYNIIDSIADIIEENKIPIYSLIGNHVMECGHIENSENTGLVHLQKRSKYFKKLTELDDREFKSNNPFTIIGIDYEFEIEKKLKNELKLDKYNYKNIEKWTIYVIHALITPTKFFESVSHAIPEEINTDANLILVAHYHHPYQKIVNNTEFLNIGCTGRLSINEAKIEPSVLLLDTDKRSYKIIKLKSAKQAPEIFDLSKYTESKLKEKSIEDFISSLESYDWQAINIKTQIKNIAEVNKVDKKIINYVFQTIKEIDNGK